MEIEAQDNISTVIIKYLVGSANAQEEADLINWVLASESNKQYFNQVKNIWETSDKRFNPELIKTEAALDRVLNRVTKRYQIETLWNYWKKIASVVLIPLLIGNIIWLLISSPKESSLTKPIYSEVYAAFGTRTALKLPDGSSVWLNSGSRLKYPDRFFGKERVVYLDGEGYFEVMSNKSVPFIVHTSSITVKATGTKFNVSDYKFDQVSNVILVEGKVFVNELADSLQSEKVTELLPSQHLSYNKKERVASIEEDDIREYVAWKDGKLIFRNEPLSYVVGRISQMYNVDIELRGNKLQDYRYRATFQDESLTEILKLLKISSPIDYLEVKRIPLADGTFPRKKVIIFPVKEVNK